jgi:cyanophycin synthetase
VVALEHSDLGDMIMIKEGRRSMQLAWTHLLRVTFSGRGSRSW